MQVRRFLTLWVTILVVLFTTCQVAIERNSQFESTEDYKTVLKNEWSAFDSIQTISYLSCLFTAVHEPFLGVADSGLYLRIVYDAAMSQPIVIRLSGNIIEIKVVTDPHYASFFDDRVLNDEEQRNLDLIHSAIWNQPNDSLSTVNYWDSLQRSDSQLYSVGYYSNLVNKITERNKVQLRYSNKRIEISTKERNTLLDAIGSSGFLQEPHNRADSIPSMDGYVFYLEAGVGSLRKYVITGSSNNHHQPFQDAWQKLMELASVSKIAVIPPINSVE